MKRIFKLSIVIVFAVIIASCTDEKDLLDNKPIKNKKTLEEEIYRTYSKYEDVDYTESQVQTMMRDFDLAINDY